MIYLIAIILLATSAALVWLLNWVMGRDHVHRMRTLLLLVCLALVPAIAGLVVLFIRNLVLDHS